MEQQPRLSQVKNQITKDWQLELPKLGVYRARCLLRRVGPLLVGVTLLGGSARDHYEPFFHVHFLGKNFPELSLTLATSPTGRAQETVYLSSHAARYKDLVRQLVARAPLSIEGPLTIKEVIAAYREFIKTPKGQGQIIYLYEDCIKLLACYGLADQARAMLDEILGIAKEDYGYTHFGGRESFYREMLESIEQPQKVWDQVEQSLKALKVPRRVPVEEFVKD